MRSGLHLASPSFVIYLLSQSVKYSLPASDQIYILNLDLSLVQIQFSTVYLIPPRGHLISIWNTKWPNRTQFYPCHPSPCGRLLLTPILPIKTNATTLQTIAQALKLEVTLNSFILWIHPLLYCDMQVPSAYPNLPKTPLSSPLSSPPPFLPNTTAVTSNCSCLHSCPLQFIVYTKKP